MLAIELGKDMAVSENAATIEPVAPRAPNTLKHSENSKNRSLLLMYVRQLKTKQNYINGNLLGEIHNAYYTIIRNMLPEGYQRCGIQYYTTNQHKLHSEFLNLK